jgi:hypothetical protein
MNLASDDKRKKITKHQLTSMSAGLLRKRRGFARNWTLSSVADMITSFNGCIFFCTQTARDSVKKQEKVSSQVSYMKQKQILMMTMMIMTTVMMMTMTTI